MRFAVGIGAEKCQLLSRPANDFSELNFSINELEFFNVNCKAAPMAE